MDRADIVINMVMMMTVTVASDSFSMIFMTVAVAVILNSLLLLFTVRVRAAGSVSMSVVFTEVSMLMEEGHTDNIDDETDYSYDDHLTAVDNGRVIHSF